MIPFSHIKNSSFYHRDIPKKGNKTPHPYVQLALQSPGKDDRKESTDILDKTTDPIVEKGFKFRLDQPLSECILKITVKTKHTFHHAVGKVSFHIYISL